jgi:hypothetical protein
MALHGGIASLLEEDFDVDEYGYLGRFQQKLQIGGTLELHPDACVGNNTSFGREPDFKSIDKFIAKERVRYAKWVMEQYFKSTDQEWYWKLRALVSSEMLAKCQQERRRQQQ